MAEQVTSLSVDDLIALHDEALTLGNGGSGGIRLHHQLASAALQPFQTVFGEDAYPSIPERQPRTLSFCLKGTHLSMETNELPHWRSLFS